MAADDDRFVETVRRAWGRPELDSGARARFDAELRARLAAPARRPWLVAVAGVAVAASLAIALLVLRSPERNGRDLAPSWVSLAAEAAGVPVSADDDVGLDLGTDDDGMRTLLASGDDYDLGSLVPRSWAGMARWLEPPGAARDL